MSADYQHFRSRGDLIRVKVTTNPATGQRYVFWGDLRVCFPGLVRVQHHDIFVPFMRCLKEYRIKPLRIEYVPDVLDVIYKDDIEAATPLPFSILKAASPTPSPTSAAIVGTSPKSSVQDLPTVEAGSQIAERLSSRSDKKQRIHLDRSRAGNPEGMTAMLDRVLGDVGTAHSESTKHNESNAGVESISGKDLTSKTRPVDNATGFDHIKDMDEEYHIIDAEVLGQVMKGSSKSQHDSMNGDSIESTGMNSKDSHQNSGQTSLEQHYLQSDDRSALGVMNKALERAISHAILEAVENTPSTITGKKKGGGRGKSAALSRKSSAATITPTVTEDESQALVVKELPQQTLRDPSDEANDKGEDKAAVFNFEAARNGLVETTHLFQAFIQASAKGQLSVADKIGLQLSRQLEELEIRLEMGSQLRPQFAQLCKALSDTQRSLHLIREPLIQNRIQTILDQKLGLVDQLFPRLFIILPKGLDSKEFRVHFLCECGSHPHNTNKKPGVPAYIHLTDHEGYDIEFQDDFMEKFGSYMLDFLNMLKYGVMLDGMYIPPLEDSTYLMLRVNRSMEYLMNVTSTEHDGKDWLNSLSSYLKNASKDSCLGHLYRTVSEEGYTSWICFDHYNELGYEPLVTRFAEAYTRCAAHYVDGHQGLVHVMIQERAQAEQFYKALEFDPPIHDLGILLDWDLTVSDLNNLLQALRKTRVPIIRICLPRCEKPTDILKSAKEGLIAYMLSNMQVQCFLFGDFTDQLRRFEPNTRLLIIRRALDMNHWRRDNVTVAIIVRDTQKWTKVSLFNRDIERGLEMVKKNMGGDFHRLKTLALDTGTEERALIEFDNGEMTSLELRALWPTSNYLLLSSFIRKLQVTIALEQNYPELARIVKRNQGLVELDINCLMKNMADVFMLVKRLAQDHPSLSQIRLRNDGTMLSWCDVDLKGVGTSMSLNAFEYRGLDPILKLVAADLNYFSGQLSDAQAAIFERATGSHLAIAPTMTSPSTSTAMTAATTKDKASTTTLGVSKLRVLSLEISPLTQPGFESVYRLIVNSPKLDRMEVKIWCRPGHKLDWNRYATFVSRIGHRTNALQLQGGNVNTMLQHMGAKVPDPSQVFKVLNTFEIRGESVVATPISSTSAGAGANEAGTDHTYDTTAATEGEETDAPKTEVMEEESSNGTAATTTAALTSTATASKQMVNVTKLRDKHVPWVVSVLGLSSLTTLMIRKIWIDADGWDLMLEALNFSKLVSIDVQASNFGVEQMDKLVQRVPSPSPLPSPPTLVDSSGLGSVTKGIETEAEAEKTPEVLDDNTPKQTDASTLVFAPLNDLNIHLSVKPTNEMKQQWEAALKVKTRDLLFQCEADF
ncbi:hypothetical protein EC968_009387 [Mortierella alpina]|nr:hypothetical protein EC968_009387 [Mortierella alpina]